MVQYAAFHYDNCTLYDTRGVFEYTNVEFTSFVFFVHELSHLSHLCGSAV